MAHTWTFTVDSLTSEANLVFGISFYADTVLFKTDTITVEAVPTNDAAGILAAVTPLAQNIVDSNYIDWNEQLDSATLSTSLQTAVASLTTPVSLPTV